MDPELFKNPPTTYREVPFWSWNDALEPAELARQVALMAEGGWGGFFMHARTGLRTRYLGQNWMACVRASLEAARAHGLEAWLYDEKGWPSGFGGGLSVASNPDFLATHLVCHLSEHPAHIAGRVAAFTARVVAGDVTEVHPYDPTSWHPERDWLLQFYVQRFPLGMTWYHGLSYLNPLNPEAVRAFLGSTHETYARAVGDAFGGTVPGVFTDEPSPFIPLFDDPASQLWALPWVDDLLHDFRAETGEDLTAQLPALFFNVGDYQSVRYGFWRAVSRRFLESYTRQVSGWCAAHGLKLTGHLMGEDTLRQQVFWSGAVMPHYALMQLPGVDKLGRSLGADTVLAVKQLDSVASQLGTPRALCESYGCTGQNLAHAGRKGIADALFALGVNLINPHLAPYSLRGARKRDYPPALFYQQPWWPENRLIADYTARLSYALSQGQRAVEVLVIHPLGSAWSVYRPNAGREVAELGDALSLLLLTLTRNHRDVHLGDELLLAEGTLEGQVTQDAEGARLRLGLMAYRVVIVPPSVTLMAPTVRLLHAFAAQGGTVLALEPHPTRLDGRLADEPVLPRGARTVTLETLVEVLDETPPAVGIHGSPALWLHHRRLGDGGELVFVANTEWVPQEAVTLRLRGGAPLELWDAATGVMSAPACRRVGADTEVMLDFAAAGSHLLVRRPEGATAAPPEATPESLPKADKVFLDAPWEVVSADPNALVLDAARLQLGSAPWSEPTYSLDLQEAVSKVASGTPFSLAFDVKVAARPLTPVDLVLEVAGSFRLELNGVPHPLHTSSWWLDPAFERVGLGSRLRRGLNRLVLHGVKHEETELESCYLVGTFGVRGRYRGPEGAYQGQTFDRYSPRFHLTRPPTTLAALSAPGLRFDLTRQGFPFLAGRVRLRQRVTVRAPTEGTRLELEGLQAAVTHVFVNGERAGSLAWAPYSLDIGAHLVRGENLIELELVGTLRNLLGPHHLQGGDREWTGPQQFRDPRRWTEDVVLTPFGFDRVTLHL